MDAPESVSRRRFLRRVGALGATGLGSGSLLAACNAPAAPPGVVAGGQRVAIDAFDRPDSNSLGDAWESLTPGYWKIENGALRRRLAVSPPGPSPPGDDAGGSFGMLWRRDWWLTGNYTVQIDFTIAAMPEAGDGGAASERPALFGIGFGSECLFEGGSGSRETTPLLDRLRPGSEGNTAAWMLLWTQDGRFGIYSHTSDILAPVDPRAETETRRPRPGESGSLVLFVDGPDPRYAAIEAMLFYDDTWHAIAVPNVNREAFTEGFFGIVSRGAMDVAVDSVSLAPRQNEPLDTPLNELLVCYPLLDTLRAEAGMWRCRFVALCRDDGARLALRIAEVPQPEGGWASIAVAGEAEVVSNDFRLRTAVIDALMPFDPSSRTLYYTVWQDNMDVTPDPRIGTASVGAGTGYLGTVPANGRYVGRLPQLTAPYRLCGLSSHAVIGGQPDLPRAEKYQAWYVHDQPTPGAYQHLEDFGFQALVWDANIWYLPEEQAAGHLEDAYTVIATTLAGPTTRWQMMRHWNILNPGLGELGSPAPADAGVAAHDSEAASTRTPRNQRIALHLTRGVETFDVAREPRNWRRWRSPAGDFSVYLVDARLRKARGAAADADILGERQYAWLMEGLRTDPAPLICVVGIDALHDLHGRDAAAQHPAGLAPWPRRVADRAIEALGGRDGVVTVYGNEHAATLVRNVDHNLCECGFGPIGARPARRDTPLPPAQQTRDRHGRPVHVYAQYPTPTAAPGVEHEEGSWNFLEMHVDPSGSDPYIEMTIRNLTDATDAASRGGVPLRLAASEMGRPRTSRLPPFQTLANADVRLSRATGEPVRAYRSLANGRLPESGLIDIPPGTMLVVTTYGPAGVEARMIETLPL